ncbi:MAG: lactonase family protein [Aerococcaceae bacterium]|nr:lactonase family protein [Aerococcaceae bacterium]
MQDYLLGGYTKRANQGVLAVAFDSQTAQFTTPQLIAPLSQPTYLGVADDGQLFFAIHKGEDKSGIVAFQRTTTGWQEISRLLDSDIPGCHVCYRASSRTIYVANYHEGALYTYRLNDANQLEARQRLQYSGSSIHPNQKSSHIHYAGLNHTQTLLFVCDLGTDIVSSYHVDDEGNLTLASEFHAPVGTGPRHLVLHPTLPIAYIIGELANTTLVVSVENDGTLQLIQTIANVPEKYLQTSAGAAIRITKDGRFLYTSTRFHNTMTVYHICEHEGTLTFVQQIDTQGEIPRDFVLDASERYVLVPHQDSDHISVFERDTSTGTLRFLHNTTCAPECVCIAHA